MAPDYVDMRKPSVQLAADMREQILSGDLADRLPSYAALEKMFGASVNACQNGVKILKDEGLVYGEQGKQLTIRPPHIQVIVAGAAPVKGAGITYDLKRVEVVPAPARIRRALGSDEPVLLREMVEMKNGVPQELVRNYYPTALAGSSVLAKNVKVGDANEVLARVLGERLVRMRDTLSERPPTRAEAKSLRLPPQLNIIQTIRVLFVADGRAVQASQLIKPGQWSEVQYDVYLH